MRILIADDDRTCALTLRAMLEKMGYEVIVASDGDEAWARLQRETFRLVILDWQMPGLDGLEVARRIRALGSTPYTYIMLVAAGDELHAPSAFPTEPDDHLCKPLDPAVMAFRLNVAERILTMQAQLQHAQEALEVRVDERTRALAHANRALRDEVAEHAQAEAEIIHLNRQLERRLRRIDTLRQIDVAITSSMDMRFTIQVFLQLLVGQVHMDAAQVLLYSPHTKTLSHYAHQGLESEALHRVRVQLDRGRLGRAVMNHEPLALLNLEQELSAFDHAPLLAREGITTYHAIPLVAKGKIKGVLELCHREPFTPDAEWLHFADALAGQAAIAIDSAQMFAELERSNIEMALAYDATIEGWSRALDLRDRETEGHCHRVTDVTTRLAYAMELPEADLVHIRRGALLHDIGKMGVPDSILLKPDKLTEDEWHIMRMHPQFAYEMLSPIAFLRPALDIPYCHHEKWDGTGYPRGLKGTQIPLSARLFAIVDVWDALGFDRPYRRAWPQDKVLAHIEALSGTHFDPDVVTAFLSLMQAEREANEMLLRAA